MVADMFWRTLLGVTRNRHSKVSFFSSTVTRDRLSRFAAAHFTRHVPAKPKSPHQLYRTQPVASPAQHHCHHTTSINQPTLHSVRQQWARRPQNRRTPQWCCTGIPPNAQALSHMSAHRYIPKQIDTGPLLLGPGRHPGVVPVRQHTRGAAGPAHPVTRRLGTRAPLGTRICRHCQP